LVSSWSINFVSMVMGSPIVTSSMTVYTVLFTPSPTSSGEAGFALYRALAR